MPSNSWMARLRGRFQTLLSPPEDEDPNALVTLATFQPVMRAHAELLRTRLEAEGISCIINGEWIAQPDFVRLQVRRADAVEAAALLAEMEAA